MSKQELAQGRSPKKSNLGTLWTNYETALKLIGEVASGKSMPRAGCKNCHKGIIYLVEGKDRLIHSSSDTCECAKKVEHVKYCAELLNAANFPNKVLEKYNPEKYKEDVITKNHISSFVGRTDQKVNWMYMHGAVGTGKTYSACLAGLYNIAVGKSVLYVNLPMLMDALRPSEDDSGRLWKERCRGVDLLILDDIGQEKPSVWVTEQLYILLQNRYHDDKKTILTSNYSLETGNLQPQITSRILEKAVIVEFDGPDKRLTDL